jgi:hypothetical protein
MGSLRQVVIDCEQPFDIESADWLAEIERLTSLGATVKELFEANAWMRDPEGNDFCIVAGDR